MAAYPYAVPRDGFTETGLGNVYIAKSSNEFHNVSAADVFKVGTKIRYYNDRQSGWGTAIYLRYSKGAETLAAGYIVQPDPALTSLYYVTGDASTFVQLAVGKPCAIALSAMTTAYYGWFWCGGVCPDFNTAASTAFSATTCATDDSLTAGEGFGSDGATDAHLEAYNVMAVHTADNNAQAGWVLADDGGVTATMAKLVLIDWWP